MESLRSMQSEVTAKPLRAKRSNQYLAEEGDPSDTDSHYDAAAGLPPVHQRKARRIDGYNETMDLDMDMNPARLTINETSITDPFPAYKNLSYEMAENVTPPNTEGLRSMTPPATQAASSTARAGSSGRRSYPLSKQKVIHRTASNEVLQKCRTSLRPEKTEKQKEDTEATQAEFTGPLSRLSDNIVQEGLVSQPKQLPSLFQADSFGAVDSIYGDAASLRGFHHGRDIDGPTLGSETAGSTSSRLDESFFLNIDITSMPSIPENPLQEETAESTEHVESVLRPGVIHANNVQTGNVSPAVYHPYMEGDPVPSPAGAAVKLEQEQEGVITIPNSASDLYNKLVAEGHVGYPSAIIAWYATLGLPCHPERVEIKHKSKVEATPVESQRPKQKYYIASTLDQATLTEYCRWGFSYITHAKEDPAQQCGKQTYRVKYQYPENRVGLSGPNFEEHPKAKLDPNGLPRALDRLIENHLGQEVYRMRNAKLVIPTEWQEEANVPLPLNYLMPDAYERHLKAAKKFDKRLATPIAVHATSETEASQSDGQAVKVPNRETARARTARRAIEKLCRTHDIDKNPDANPNQTTKIVEAFHKEWKKMNLPFHKARALRDALHSIGDFEELNDYIQSDTRKNIQELDIRKRSGDATSNENTTLIEEYPPFIIEDFLKYAMGEGARPSEVEVEKTVGALLRNVVTGEGMKISDGNQLSFPPHLRPVGSSPRPDLFVRASIASWAKDLAPLFPVLLAGEGKRAETVDVEDICAQLATAFHGSLIILILYYLDTRKDLTTPLPPWLFLYGIEYTQCGVNICAHYPSYEFTGETGQWRLKATILTQEFVRLFQAHNAVKRMRFVAVLNKIRSHCNFVLEQLQKWDRAEHALRPLLKSS